MIRYFPAFATRVALVSFIFAPPLVASASTSSGSITSVYFGAMPDGMRVDLFILRNRHGMEARIATYGGTVTSLTAPDREGHFQDVVLGYDNLAAYLKSSPYFGGSIGRYATSKCLVLDATCK